jgi:hypothetical protein
MSATNVIENTPSTTWQRPDVQLGDRVIMARGLGDLNNPGGNRRYAAIVTKICSRTIEAVVLPHGERSLFHADDPALGSNPQWLAEDDTGVWRLAESEERAKELQAEIDALQSLVGTLSAKVAAIERDMRTLTEPITAKRGPGRPPKQGTDSE